MGLLFAPGLLHYMELYRSTYISGRYGAGKTVLAFELARRLARRRNLPVVANLPFHSYSTTSRADFPQGLAERAVVVLDEAADFLDPTYGSKDILKLFKYFRHLDLTFLLPSIDPVHHRLRKLVIEGQAEITWATLTYRRAFIYKWWIGPSLTPPPKPARARTNRNIGWIVYVPGNFDFAYNSQHKGHGLSTTTILKQLKAATAHTQLEIA